MERTINTKKLTLLLHLSFWVLYVTYRIYDIESYVGIRKAIIYTCVPLGFHMAASYVHYFFIFPVWLRQKHIKRYLVFVVLLIATAVSFRIFTENIVLAPLSETSDYYKTVKLPRVISCVWDVSVFLFFTGMIRFTIDRFELEGKRKQLENQKLMAELNYLKAQINPHFLFNTLHNLNYLVYSGSKNATDVIIKLSNIMRYMIYDANREKVQLTRELAYMEDYVHLESIRLNNSFRLEFKKTGDFANVEVAPLLLITLLENSFKHGVKDAEPDCWIECNLNVMHDQLVFNTRNKKLRGAKADQPSGFGLENLKKRLQLSYPQKYDLRIVEDERTYFIELILQRT
jgi:LytS/YehU family sensor histidine kinase